MRTPRFHHGSCLGYPPPPIKLRVAGMKAVSYTCLGCSKYPIRLVETYLGLCFEISLNLGVFKTRVNRLLLAKRALFSIRLLLISGEIVVNRELTKYKKKRNKYF